MKSYTTFFLEHLAQLPSVTEVKSMVSLLESKATTALPIR
jgi:hypothetical protein